MGHVYFEAISDSITKPVLGMGPMGLKLISHVEFFVNMATVSLSAFERSYIIRGVQEGIRADGREAKDYRHFDLTTNVIPNTNGSAEIKMVDIIFKSVIWQPFFTIGKDKHHSWC